MGATESELSESELALIATTAVKESESAFASLSQLLDNKLADFSHDVQYRALAISLIYMLANHLRRHAAMTSVEDSVELATHHLTMHMRSLSSDCNDKRDRSH